MEIANSGNARTSGRGEEARLSSGWISIGSELSFLNINSSVRAEESFVIHNPNLVLKSLCIVTLTFA